TSIEMLIALRCLQALGVAGAPVLARAIVRDLYQGVRAGRELARMGSITALAPVVAPSLGGVLQATFGWRASFLGMAALGLCAIILVVRLLPETMKQPPTHPMSLLSIIRGYGMFLRHRTFRIYLAIVAASYGGLFAWISGSSFVLQDLYGLSPLLFGLVFAAATLGYGLGTLLAARLVVRIGIDRTIVCGGVALAAGGLAMWRPPSRWARPRPPPWPHRWRSISAVSAWPCRNRWRARSCRFPSARAPPRRCSASCSRRPRPRSASWSGKCSDRARCRWPRSSPPWAFSRLRSRYSGGRWVPFIKADDLVDSTSCFIFMSCA